MSQLPLEVFNRIQGYGGKDISEYSFWLVSRQYHKFVDSLELYLTIILTDDVNQLLFVLNRNRSKFEEILRVFPIHTLAIALGAVKIFDYTLRNQESLMAVCANAIRHDNSSRFQFLYDFQLSRSHFGLEIIMRTDYPYGRYRFYETLTENIEYLVRTEGIQWTTELLKELKRKKLLTSEFSRALRISSTKNPEKIIKRTLEKLANPDSEPESESGSRSEAVLNPQQGSRAILGHKYIIEGFPIEGVQSSWYRTLLLHWAYSWLTINHLESQEEWSFLTIIGDHNEVEVLRREVLAIWQSYRRLPCRQWNVAHLFDLLKRLEDRLTIVSSFQRYEDLNVRATPQVFHNLPTENVTLNYHEQQKTILLRGWKEHDFHPESFRFKGTYPLHIIEKETLKGYRICKYNLTGVLDPKGTIYDYDSIEPLFISDRLELVLYQDVIIDREKHFPEYRLHLMVITYRSKDPRMIRKLFAETGVAMPISFESRDIILPMEYWAKLRYNVEVISSRFLSMQSDFTVGPFVFPCEPKLKYMSTLLNYMPTSLIDEQRLTTLTFMLPKSFPSGIEVSERFAWFLGMISPKADVQLVCEICQRVFPCSSIRMITSMSSEFGPENMLRLLYWSFKLQKEVKFNEEDEWIFGGFGK